MFRRISRSRSPRGTSSSRSPRRMSGSRSPLVQGYVQPGFELVRQEFEASFREGRESAAQVAVYHGGKLVVDLWGGDAVMHASSESAASKAPICGDDIAVIFSCTKVAESLVIAMLVDRGLIEYKARIAQYWPEFAAHGKGDITVEQLMRHQSCLSAFSTPIPLEEVMDNDKTRLSSRLASHQPNFSVTKDLPTRQFYHAITRGLYASEIVRRVDPKGRTLGEFFREEVAQPLGISFSIGLSSDERKKSRIMSLVKPPPSMLLKRIPQYFADSQATRSFLAGGDAHNTLEDWEAAAVRGMLRRAMSFDMELNRLIYHTFLPICGLSGILEFDRPDVHAAEIPSAGGLSNARSMAKLASLIAEKAGPQNPLFENESARQQALCHSDVLLDEVLNMQMAYTSAGWGVDRFLPGFVGWAGAGDAVMQWSEDAGGVGFAYLPTMAYGRTQKPRGLRLMRATVTALRVSKL